ncbi:MAG: hypothetical protein IJA87_07750 [Clostridia bacterium]|nr:hypothetical protein [Clostridia bacterium]
MKKVLSIVLVIAVMACIGAGFTGCDKVFAPKLEKEIVGTWVSDNSQITFREDGSLSGTVPFLGSVSLNGTYTVNSDTNQVTVTYSLPLGLSKDTIFNVVIEEDTLTVSGGLFETTTVYTRQTVK